MKTFERGGIHPPDMKESTKDLPLEEFLSSQTLCVPMLQHLGRESKPLVSVGDAVLRGQRIADADGFISITQHSPVSGKVEAVEPRWTHLGKRVNHVIIKNDFTQKWASSCNEKRDWNKFSAEELKNIIQSCGIVGMGGAAFPTHVKLSPPKEKPIDVLIINGVECEPYLTADHRLMLEKADEIIEGARIMMKILGVKIAYVGVEANKKDAYRKLCDAALKFPDIKVVLLQVKYPQGGERQLIKALVNRDVPLGGLPFDIGVVVQNVGTAFAVCEACKFNRPLIERVVTVTGDAIERPANLIVSIGTPVKNILEKCGLKKGVKKVILGGPMMGVAIDDLDLPITKGICGILGMEKIQCVDVGPCIRCGRCVKVCPLGQTPAEMSVVVEMNEESKFEDYKIGSCLECGSCAFICPARRRLVQEFKKAKEMMAIKKMKGSR